MTDPIWWPFGFMFIATPIVVVLVSILYLGIRYGLPMWWRRTREMNIQDVWVRVIQGLCVVVVLLVMLDVTAHWPTTDIDQYVETDVDYVPATIGPATLTAAGGIMVASASTDGVGADDPPVTKRGALLALLAMAAGHPEHRWMEIAGTNNGEGWILSGTTTAWDCYDDGSASAISVRCAPKEQSIYEGPVSQSGPWLTSSDSLPASKWIVDLGSLEGGMILRMNGVEYTVSQADLWRTITGTEPPTRVGK